MEHYLSAKDLAARLNVPVSWVYDRTRINGPDRLPHFKIGKYVRFSEAEVAVYLETRRGELTKAAS